jgi:hypothetical protein
MIDDAGDRHDHRAGRRAIARRGVDKLGQPGSRGLIVAGDGTGG